MENKIDFLSRRGKGSYIFKIMSSMRVKVYNFRNMNRRE